MRERTVTGEDVKIFMSRMEINITPDNKANFKYACQAMPQLRLTVLVTVE